MKFKYALFFILLFTYYSYAQSTSLFDSYKIPRISFQTLDLKGDNLLNLHTASYGDDGSKNNTFNINLGLTHYLFFQSPMFTNTISTSFHFIYNKKTEENIGSPAAIDEIISGSLMVSSYNNWYLVNERGVFLFFNPSIYVSDYKNSINKDESKQNSFSTYVGAGYGRIISIRNIVQAYSIADELNCNLSNEKLLQLAEVIERHTHGEYKAKYKDEADIYFYKDISSITGKPGSELKIMQILSSNLYQTLMKETGWQASIGLRYTYNDDNDFYASSYEPFSVDRLTKGADLVASFNYSLPVGFNKQLLAAAEYSLNLNDNYGRFPKLFLSASFSIDHNYLWSSKLSVFYNTAFAIGKDNLINYGVSLFTKYVLLNKFSINAHINYSGQQFYNISLSGGWNPELQYSPKQKDFSISIGLNYHIF